MDTQTLEELKELQKEYFDKEGTVECYLIGLKILTLMEIDLCRMRYKEACKNKEEFIPRVILEYLNSRINLMSYLIKPDKKE